MMPTSTPATRSNTVPGCWLSSDQTQKPVNNFYEKILCNSENNFLAYLCNVWNVKVEI